jgi:hypothetical protein
MVADEKVQGQETHAQRIRFDLRLGDDTNDDGWPGVGRALSRCQLKAIQYGFTMRCPVDSKVVAGMQLRKQGSGVATEPTKADFVGFEVHVQAQPNPSRVCQFLRADFASTLTYFAYYQCRFRFLSAII